MPRSKPMSAKSFSCHMIGNPILVFFPASLMSEFGGWILAGRADLLIAE
jgi:hypothetical protein